MPPTPPHCAEPLTPLTPADANADEGTHDAEYWKQKALDAEQKALALQALLEATQARPRPRRSAAALLQWSVPSGIARVTA